MTTPQHATSAEYRRLRNLLALLSVLIFTTLGAIWLDGRNDEQARCEQSNAGRQVIKDAFNKYTDALGRASGAQDSPQLEAFRKDVNGTLDKGLPQKEC